MQTACQTCRRRRLACDRSKPTCARCYTDGRVCGGYSRHDQPLFVNFDSNNIKLRKKRVLSQAIADQKRQNSTSSLRLDANDHPSSDPPRPSLDNIMALDFPPAKFTAHFTEIWKCFTAAFNRTQDAWALAYDHLALHSRALDLSLIALSLQRMAIVQDDAHLAQMAHKTYGEALCTVRELMQNINEQPDTFETTDLALTAATCLALGLLDGSRWSPTTIFPSGWINSNPHFEGAREMRIRAGPDAFTSGGLHLIFKKMREMELFNALCSYRHSCLTEPQWLTSPWKLQHKTWRDKLWDLGCKIVCLAIDERGLDASVCTAIGRPRTQLPVSVEDSKQDSVDCLLGRLRITQEAVGDVEEQTSLSSIKSKQITASVTSLLGQLRQWHTAWTDSRQNPVLDPASANAIFLSAEYRALLLILHLIDFRIRSLSGEYAVATESRAYSCSLGLADTIRSTLNNPYYMLSMDKISKPGLTEGQCRSLMPIWSISLADIMLHPAASASHSLPDQEILDPW